jgi:hypothetical protein
MATYITGVTEYIPDFQPFQPDYNFYMNVLQTKQNQYDSNYKSLNNLYGQLYYQDVTRDDSNKMKNDYLKNIDYELKRVSALDLSLDQNVEQAKQVFRPMYENKNLMKDMALTKNYKNERSRATALATSKNKEDRSSYWDEGIKGMDYMLEEFKNADASQVLNFSNITYTPFVNATNRYLELAEKYDLSVDITQPDKSGMYMVRQKNGDLVIPSLQKLFYSEFASDPALQKVKAVEAYVKRKDEIKARAPKYNNNETVAEKEYLKEQFLFLKDFTKEKTVQAEDALISSKNKKNSVENNIKSGEVNPFQPSFLQKIQEAIKVDDIVYNHNKNLSEEINSSVKTYQGATDITSIEGLDLDNIELARQKVDMMYGNYIAEKEIIDAAEAYSKHGMILDYDVNPIGLENMRHSHNLTRDAINNQAANRRAEAKIIADKENAVLKWQLDNGYAEVNSQGQVVPVEASPQKLETSEGGETGNTTNEYVNNLKYNREVLFETVDKLSPEYVETWVNTIKSGMRFGEINKSDLAYLLGQNQEWGQKMWNKLVKDYDDPNKRKQLIKELTVNSKIFDYRNRMDKWALKNKGLESANMYQDHAATSGYKLDKMKQFYDVHVQNLKDNRGRIINTLSSTLEANGITNDKLRYTIINEYMDKYVTGKIYDDDDFNDHLENIFDSFKKKGVDQEPPGFFSRVGKAITSLPGAVSAAQRAGLDPTSTAYKVFTSTSGKDLLSNMNESYVNLVKNPNHDVGLKSYLPNDKSSATGKGSIGATPVSIDVNLGRKDDNFAMFHQFLEDLRKTNFNQADVNTHRVSLKGNVNDPDYKVNIDLNNKLKNMLFDLSNLSRNKDQKNKPSVFQLLQSQVGAENANLGMMKVKQIPTEIVEKYFDKSNAEDAKIIKDIKTNGITYIAPKTSWNNSLFQSNRITPTQAILNLGREIEYVDPKYGHKMVLSKDPASGQYGYNMIIRGVNENGEYEEVKVSDFAQNYGGGIDGVEGKFMNQIATTNKYMDNLYKKFHAENFQKGLETFKRFEIPPKNAGYKTK